MPILSLSLSLGALRTEVVVLDPSRIYLLDGVCQSHCLFLMWSDYLRKPTLKLLYRYTLFGGAPELTGGIKEGV